MLKSKTVDKINKKQEKRILGRSLARELSVEELARISGAGDPFGWCGSNPTKDDHAQ